jgi:hypothetical protein
VCPLGSHTLQIDLGFNLSQPAADWFCHILRKHEEMKGEEVSLYSESKGLWASLLRLCHNYKNFLKAID